MRNFLLLTTVIAAGLTVAGIEVKAQSYSSPGAGMWYNGPPYGGRDEMMGGNRSTPGTMMGRGYDHGVMMRDARRPGYRGDRSCWKETDSVRGFGYYAPCSH